MWKPNDFLDATPLCMAVTSDQENKCLKRTMLDCGIRNSVSWMLKTLKMELKWPLPQIRSRRPLWRCFSASWIPRCHWYLYKSFQVSGTRGWIKAKSKRKRIPDASKQMLSNALASPMRIGICLPAQCWGPRAWGKPPYSRPHFCSHPERGICLPEGALCVQAEPTNSCPKGLLCSALTFWYFLPLQTRGDSFYCFAPLGLIQINQQLETFREAGFPGILK